MMNRNISKNQILFEKTAEMGDILYMYKSIYCTVKRREAATMTVKNTYPISYKSQEERTEAVKKAYKKVYITMVLQSDIKKEEKKTP